MGIISDWLNSGYQLYKSTPLALGLIMDEEVAGDCKPRL